VYCVLEMSKDDGESSKQAVKRAKKERRAIAAALRDELEYLEDIEFSESDTDSNSESDSDATTTLSPHMKKKTRGPAKIDFVAPIDGKRIERTQVSEDASTIHGDALTHVLGKERNGRVRGAGSGVTAMLMNLEALSKSHTAQIKMELKDLKKLFEELKAAFIKNTIKQADHNETSHKRKCSEDTSHAKKAKTCRSTFTNIENAHCRLLDWEQEKL
ncbi:hypothetical protein CUMW_217230, partial [Citrus unshiu]